MFSGGHELTSLSVKTTRTMLACLLLVLLAQGYMLGTYNSAMVHEITDSKIEMILRTQAAQAAVPLWDYEISQIESQVMTLQQEPLVAGARVIEEVNGKQNVIAKAGVQPGTDLSLKTMTAPIIFISIDKEKKRIGHIDLVIDYSSIEQKITNISLLVFATTSLVFLVACLVVFWLLKRAIKPVTVISDMMSREDVVQAMPAEIEKIQSNTLEVRHLIEAINLMQRNHQKYHTDLLASKEAAEKARVLAENASMAKSAFLANMSHELRTPLNSIIGLSDLLMEGSLPGDLLSPISTMNISSKSLLHIINDILDFSKIEAGGIVLENIPFRPHDCLKQIVQMMLPQASARGLLVNLKSDIPSDLEASGDPNRFMQILTNLIGNAVKYTLKGYVDVVADCKPSSRGRTEVHVCIIDTGIGIAADKLPHIFNAFFQEDASFTRRYGGTGLGLSITKSLVEMMGGKIVIESLQGIGSKFSFTVLLNKVEGAASVASTGAALAPPVAAEKEQAPQKPAFSPPPGGGIPAGRVRILVAEDHPMNQEYVRRLLSSLGIKSFTVVENGREAFREATESQYDLILMDCHMPEMTGYEATLQIRNAEKETGRHTPIVAMTANAMAGERDNCLRCGMDEYVSKPVDKKKFVTTLSSWIIFDVKPSSSEFVVGGAERATLPAADLPVLNIQTFHTCIGESVAEQKNMVNLFITQGEKKLQGLAENCRDGRNEDWRNHAHFIKGAAATLGADRLRKFCEDAQGMLVATAAERTDVLGKINDAFAALALEFKKMGLYP